MNKGMEFDFDKDFCRVDVSECIEDIVNENLKVILYVLPQFDSGHSN
jgi:hypothetical protein